MSDMHRPMVNEFQLDIKNDLVKFIKIVNYDYSSTVIRRVNRFNPGIKYHDYYVMTTYSPNDKQVGKTVIGPHEMVHYLEELNIPISFDWGLTNE